MHKRTTPKVFSHAKELRREMTPIEVKLWARLRAHRMRGVHFRPQHAIGNYVVDFCAPRKKLIIELDGSQHLKQEEYDAKRTEFLKLKGYKVLRFWNNDVINKMDAVLNMIWRGQRTPSQRHGRTLFTHIRPMSVTSRCSVLTGY